MISSKKTYRRLLVLIIGMLVALPSFSEDPPRHRVIVSTDIGGSDPDDFQSMVHLLLYADELDIEGLISSPWGEGRKQDILDVIDLYEQDFANLQQHSDTYPTPETLRAVTKQGGINVASNEGFGQSTEGSEWLVNAARHDDPRPLHVLVWGNIEDLAQALHDAPDILPKLRVYYIGGPNKKWGPDAYHYIAEHYPNLWIIESNATYRGWFVGGNQGGTWGNKSFVSEHIAGNGALGSFFATQLGGTIKMGDTPSVAWLLNGNPEHPSEPGWGGEAPDEVEAQMDIENQALRGLVENGQVHFRFTPKGARKFSYSIRSNVASLNGRAGELTATPTPADAAGTPDQRRPNWWTDNPAPELSDEGHIGAKTVSRWREDYLRDFADRMTRVLEPLDKLVWGSSMLERDAQWYASAAARAAADSILLYQSSVGAWPKNVNLLQSISDEEMAELQSGGRANTIDNDATTLPMRFLAQVAQATGDESYENSFIRGLDYLFTAQYENGGWPQFFPLRPDSYYSHVTFNDNAMMNVMFLLRDIADGKDPYGFVDDNRVARAAAAVSRGIDLILKTQIEQDGKKTAWCAQYDEVTLEPAWARAYEPPSLSGNESVAILQFLMEIEHPTPEQVAAIEGAIAWFKKVAIYGFRYERSVDANGVSDAAIAADPDAGPLWARFYELGTNRPLFLGRDSVFRYSLDKIEQERRGGYGYYGTWAASLLAGVADARTIRIMPLGDSITYDNRRKDMRPTGVRIAYRRTLHDLLKSAGYSFDFVGSENSGDRYLGAEMDDNAGFPGITDDQLAVLISTGFAGHKSIQVTPGPYLDTYPADIILLHIGTNKVEASPDDVDDILDNIRESDPDVHIIIARIVNRYPYDEVTTTFNDNVEVMVKARADSRITMVDMENGAGIDYYTDMDDNLHPNHLGYDKMAAVWFAALEDLLSTQEFSR